MRFCLYVLSMTSGLMLLLSTFYVASRADAIAAPRPGPLSYTDVSMTLICCAAVSLVLIADGLFLLVTEKKDD